MLSKKVGRERVGRLPDLMTKVRREGYRLIGRTSRGSMMGPLIPRMKLSKPAQNARFAAF
jgi:hypothetical protein